MNAVDGNVAIDDDALTGSGDDGLDKRRKPALANAATEITALALQREDLATWRADEDSIADGDGAVEPLNPP